MYALMPWLQRYRIFDAPGKLRLDSQGNYVLDDLQLSHELRDLNLAFHDGRALSVAVAPRLLVKGSTRKKKTKDETISRLRHENEMLKETIAQLKAQLSD